MTRTKRPAQGSAPMPEAGWYPDLGSTGMLRYWTGQSWTDRLARPGTVTGPEYQYTADGSIVRVLKYA